VKEIRLHGRGGQGVVTGAEIIVHGAIEKGLFASCFPFFGFEKKGGPVAAFVRIDDQKIRPKSMIYHPDCVVAVDPTIMNSVNVFEGLKAEPEGWAIINCEAPDKVALPPEVRQFGWLNANEISLDIFGKMLPNTVMLGAFAKLTGWVEVDFVARKAADLWGEKNIEAVKAGAEAAGLINRA
jgi:pyruvate ferredoxin oxidoreductase gamma subunit/phenylglyoxylate dehydrogenase gamma subunit